MNKITFYKCLLKYQYNENIRLTNSIDFDFYRHDVLSFINYSFNY